MRYFYLFLFLAIWFNNGHCELINSKLDRNIDIASQLVKVLIKLTLENTGKSPVSSFLYALEPNSKPNLSFIGASVSIKNLANEDVYVYTFTSFIININQNKLILNGL